MTLLPQSSQAGRRDNHLRRRGGRLHSRRLRARRGDHGEQAGQRIRGLERRSDDTGTGSFKPRHQPARRSGPRTRRQRWTPANTTMLVYANRGVSVRTLPT